MTRASELEARIAELQMELEMLEPYERMTNRELAQAAGSTPTTAGRFKNGDIESMELGNVAKFLPYTYTCPLCDSTHARQATTHVDEKAGDTGAAGVGEPHRDEAAPVVFQRGDQNASD